MKGNIADTSSNKFEIYIAPTRQAVGPFFGVPGDLLCRKYESDDDKSLRKAFVDFDVVL